MREQGLQEREALGSDRARGVVDRLVADHLVTLACGLQRRRGVALLDQAKSCIHFLAQGGRLQRYRASVLAQDPGREQAE